MPDLQLLIEKAKKGESHLNHEVLKLPSMSSPWIKHLLNLVCENKTYLEIGTHQGGTLIASTYNNGSRGLAYDDYRRFGDHFRTVKTLIERHKVNATLIREDGFKHFGQKFDVIFYDGDHSEASTTKAVKYFIRFLNPSGVLIIDDYQMPTVTIGIATAIREIEYRKSNFLIADKKDDKHTWWNGLAIIQT